MGTVKINSSFDLNGAASGNIVLDTDKNVECPFCHIGIETQPICCLYVEGGVGVQVFLKCKRCRYAFIGYTIKGGNGYYRIVELSKGNRKAVEIEKDITELSPTFAQIYTEADIAEQEKLMQICGVGYRKALEFLIKDYLIKKYPNLKEKIEKEWLGDCISEYIEDARVKSIAQRATWLGNDETHYIRKWIDKDLKDLKTLIRITSNFIHNEILTDRYNEEMKERK